MSRTETMMNDVKTKAQEVGADAADAARAKAQETAQTAQAHAVSKAAQVADAADAAAAEFGPGSLQAQVAQQVAAQADTLARSIADLDVTAMNRNVSDFARNNPLLFVGGAALAGLLAARFLKARDTRPAQPTYSNDDPWRATPAPTARGGLDVPS